MENTIYTAIGNKNGISFLIYRDLFGKEGVIELSSYEDYPNRIIDLINKEFNTYILTIYMLSKYISKDKTHLDSFKAKNQILNDFVNQNNIKILKYTVETNKIRDSLANILKLKDNLDKDIKCLSVNNIYNLNPAPNKIVDIYIRAISDYKGNKDGAYAVLINNNGKEFILKEKFTNTHPNKMLLIGFINAIKTLSEPTFIRLYTHTYLGFKGEGANKELKEELFTIIKNSNHSVSEIVGREKQDYLQELLEKDL